MVRRASVGHGGDYKIYAGSFLGPDHLRRIEEEAQRIVGETLVRMASRGGRADRRP
jgi:phosphoglucomutase